MKVRIAKHAGYCYGVERAFKIIEKVSSHTDGKIYTLGPIIHNPQAVKALRKKRGISSIPDVDSITEGTVIIRTHGVPPEVMERARKRGLNVVNGTCPFVKLVQKNARRLVKDGYYLLIVGEKNHPEVVGILGHADGKARVIEDEEDIKKLGDIPDRVGVVVQTTQEVGKLQRIVSGLIPKCGELKIYNTICNATSQRQSAARKMAEEVDLMLVVGGRNSGNTRRLLSVCQETGTPGFHIETAEEIEPSWFKGVKQVGVTAGASTPDFIIEEVMSRLEELGDW